MTATSLRRATRVGIPASEQSGFVPLPRGDVFCPLLADPNAFRSFVVYQRGEAEDFARNVGAVGIADQFAFFRVGGSRAGDGWQLGVQGAVFAGRPSEGVTPGRRWSLLGEYYDGPSPYGQFHGNDIRLWGVGFHFTL